MDTEQTDLARAKREIRQTTQWALSLDCDVDAQAFRDACRDCLLSACRARGVRTPLAIPAGVVTLALACDMVGSMSIPGEIVQSSLPGAREYRDALNAD